MKLGFDVDGVFASFAPAAARQANAWFGLRIPIIPTRWDWWRDYGMTIEHERIFWERVTADLGWTAALEPEPGAEVALSAISMLANTGHDIYFITARSSDIKGVTERWLRRYGYHATPTVLMSRDKAPIALALGLDAFLDDHPETCGAVAVHVPRTYLLSRPQNLATPTPDRVSRIGSVTEFLHEIGVFPGLPVEISP